MRSKALVCLVVPFLMLQACMSSLPKPALIKAPQPIVGNGGQYCCPYTQDDTIAEWVDKGMAARAASAIGGALGRQAGESLVKSIPLVGSLVGNKVGKNIGREVAVKLCGGWGSIQNTSDLSFNSLQDMAVWLYVTKSGRPEYKKVLNLAGGIYPDLTSKYEKYIKREYKLQKAK